MSDRKKILMASVLKPVNDARMYEKFGISLASDYQVHIAGFASQIPPATENIHFHPLFAFKRISFSRITSSWKYYRLLIKVKPEVTIVNTHELLLITCLYKILFGTKILYDVQENYYLNITAQSNFPPVVKNLIAGYVRLTEKISSPFIKHFILAEKCYASELPFVKKNYTVIENKYKQVIQPEPKTYDWDSKKKITLLYSGTIAFEYGIFEAVELAIQLNKLDNKYQLNIIGYSAKKETLKQLKDKIRGYNFIKLVTDEKPIPHHQILAEITKADIGLLPYHPNESTRNCIPTKLFEYTANKLPMLIQNNTLWEEFSGKYNSAVLINFQDLKPVQVLSQLKKTRFYEGADVTDTFWESEEKKLLKLIEEIG